MPGARTAARRAGLVIDLHFPDGEAKVWYGSPRPAYLRALLEPQRIMEQTTVTMMPCDRRNLYYRKLFEGEILPEDAGDDLEVDRPVLDEQPPPAGYAFS